MFKIFKSYIKWKLISIIKDKLMHYSSEKHNYSQRQNEWKCKVYDGKCLTKERFEKEQEEQIRWSNEQWKVNHHKCEAVLEILIIVEGL
jgi:hypothetical protein